jgi:FMN phosphatase YigB (HAD superfamily)
MSAVTTVFIDIDNTLLDFGKCAALALKNAFAHYSAPIPDGVLEVFHNVNDELWRNIEKGLITQSELHDTRFVKVFDKLGGVKLDGKEFDRVFVKELELTAEPVDGAREML